jgi:hypothetical protein
MKATLFLGLLATMAAAAPVEASAAALGAVDLPTITNVLDKIQAGINTMVIKVNAFDGSAQQAAPLVADSQALITEMANGAQTIVGSNMGIMDAIKVLAPVQQLGSKVDEVVNALVQKKSEIEKAGLASAVVDQLVQQKLASNSMVNAIINGLPLPSVTSAIAQPIAKQVTDKLDMGITQFSA